jgi:hypothetical protein
LNLDRCYLTDAVGGVHDKFVFLKSESARWPLAPSAFNREIDLNRMLLIRTIEPSMF